jgi:hypothetical protein
MLTEFPKRTQRDPVFAQEGLDLGREEGVQVSFAAVTTGSSPLIDDRIVMSRVRHDLRHARFEVPEDSQQMSLCQGPGLRDPGEVIGSAQAAP